ncbi:toll-like receptor 5 [Hippocampus comes]|uniref:Toll-like receptor 5 n=1 Tax=Hippocampus comes TaxID=109280 RepID=A0A3Q2Y5Z7_HIPCM|nr:PREDICTED: toll-like receptor 5 [Hippocampus comes]
MSITSEIKAQRSDSDVYFADTQRLRQELHLRINMMRIFAFAVVVNVVLQTVPGCLSSCSIKGSVANCALKKLRWIPSLPPNITHLYLEMNHIGEINATSLSGLEMLQELDLGLQYSTLVIRNDAFRRQRRLRKLVLGFNTRLQLEPRAFSGLSTLQSLHLDYCSLDESILKENYLEPLSALETLDLFGNRIKRLQPSMFFSNMTHLRRLNLKLNRVNKICEADLAAFRGKQFESVNLDSNNLKAMFDESFDPDACGNPFKGISFGTLDLSHNGFSIGNFKLFFKAIEGTRIAHLKLSGHIGRGFSFSNLLDVNRSTFEGLGNSSVSMLDLSKNRIFALQDGVFKPLSEIQVIDLSQNRLNQIHKNAFEGLEHLKKLDLSNNLLGDIRAHSFAPLKNLKVLDLSCNHIGVLGYQAFRGLFHLEVLNLTGNSLKEFGFPSALPSLSYLSLNDNKLTFAAVDTIAAVAPNVTYLDIRNNRVENLQGAYIFLTKLKKLQHLFFGGNPIKWCAINTQVSEKKQSNVKVFDLHSSNLQSLWSQGKCLDVFEGLHHLLSLTLSSNNLRSLPKGIFQSLPSLLELDLSSNALTYLRPDAFPKSLKFLNLANNFIASPDPALFRSLSALNLNLNRFHCDSNLTNFLMWMKETNVTFASPVEDFRCEFPLAFYQASLWDYFTQLLGTGSTSNDL